MEGSSAAVQQPAVHSGRLLASCRLGGNHPLVAMHEDSSKPAAALIQSRLQQLPVFARVSTLRFCAAGAAAAARSPLLPSPAASACSCSNHSLLVLCMCRNCWLVVLLAGLPRRVWRPSKEQRLYSKSVQQLQGRLQQPVHLGGRVDSRLNLQQLLTDLAAGHGSGGAAMTRGRRQAVLSGAQLSHCTIMMHHMVLCFVLCADAGWPDDCVWRAGPHMEQ